MTPLGGNDSALFDSALEERRPIVLVAPRRSGLTHWVRRRFQRDFGSGGAIVVDGARLTSQDALRAYLPGALRLSRKLQTPSDLVLAIDSASIRPSGVIVTDCHRASTFALTWLIQALLDPLAAAPEHAPVRFLLEGSVDAEALMLEAFPNGPPRVPLIEYFDVGASWHAIALIETLCTVKFAAHASLLAPWLLDATGGDIGFVREILERTPSGAGVQHRALEAAFKYAVQQGARAREISDALEATETTLVRRLAEGGLVHELPPLALESGVIKALYLAGVLCHEPMFGAYRVRSPAAAAVLARVGGTGAPVRIDDSIQARTALLIVYVAAVELHLRGALDGTECLGLAATVTTNAPWARVSGDLRRAIAGVSPDLMKTLGPLVSRMLPERQTVREAIEARGGVIDAGNPQAVLQLATFNELLALARAANITSPQDDTGLAFVNDCRNDLAHFRGLNVDQAQTLVSHARSILERLATKPVTHP